MEKSRQNFESPSLESDSLEVLSKKLLAVTAELYEKNNALAESERKRKEMVANISHDLRAPITAIRSSLDLLSSYDTLTKEDIENTMGLINRRVATLESLIQDMYFLFCVEDDTRDFNIETVDIGPFLESYFYDAIVDSRYDSHDMQLNIPLDLEGKIAIDVQKTIRVLDNLFTNAAKYSGENSTITLSAQIKDNAVEISVSDNGVGISAEDLPHIFERSYTVSRSRTPGLEAGSGLGLAIVKAVMAKQGGAATCASRLGAGTTFALTLPLA